MGYLYRWIGLIILSSGLILACFLPLIFPESATGFKLPLVYCAYFAFLGSSLIGYFINYRQNLLGADQKNYVTTSYFQSVTIIKTLIQISLAYYTKNLYLWIGIELVFGIIYSVILNWKINKTYPWLYAYAGLGRRVFKKYPDVMSKTKQLFIHKMVPFTQYQCSSFLIYAFVSLQTVAFYGNYSIILDKITQLINTIYNSLGASVGNLIAEGNKDKIYNIYWELLSARFLIAGSISFTIYYLIQPFISLWLGYQYLLSDTIVLLISLNIFVRMTRETSDPFLFGSGLFQDTFAPIIEIIIFLIIAIIGGYLWGLSGIILAGIISMLVIGWCWKPYFLYTKLFNVPVVSTIILLAKYFLLIVISSIISIWVCSLFTIVNPYNSFGSWIIYSIMIFITYFIIGCILLLLFTKGFRDFVKRFLKINF